MYLIDSKKERAIHHHERGEKNLETCSKESNESFSENSENIIASSYACCDMS